MKAIIAKNSGYCFGVKRALEITENVLEKYKNKNISVFSMGQIIHNRGVIEDLKTRGLEVVENENDIIPGSVFIVRSHGMSPRFLKKLKLKGVIIIDTSCPFVKRAQAKAKLISKKGYHLVIIGNKDHPEVMSEMEHANTSDLTVIETPEELHKVKKHVKIGVIMQTTQIKSNSKAIIAGLLDKASQILIENTICRVTENRQDVTGRLSKNVDVMLIVGGKNSANTAHLASIARQYNSRSYHIETYKEINRSWFGPADTTVGVSGGASTPQKDISDVKYYIENFKF